MRIQLTEIEPVVKEKNYFHYTIKYTQDGKPSKRKLVSFDEPPYKAFKDAKVGETYDVQLTKDQNGNWKWLEASPVAGGGEAVPTPTNKPAWVPDANRETPEERARKQVVINRQSSLRTAVEFFKVINTPELTGEDVLKIAEEFENWVNR